MKKLLALMSASLLAMSWAAPTFAGNAFDQDVTPNVIFGSGNSNGSFTTDRQSGVEIGLRAKIPFVGLINSGGDGTYPYTLAETDHDLNGATARRWNFDWTINTDFEDLSGLVVDDLTYELGLDGDPGLGVDFLKFDPIFVIDPVGSTQCADHAFGDNTTANGAGVFVDIDLGCRSGDAATKAAATATYAGYLSSFNVAQQSWRYSFFPFGPLAGYDPNIPGTYAVYLLAKDSGGAVVARSDIQVLIGGAAAAGPIVACEGFEAPLDADVSVNKPNRVLPLRMALVDGSGFPLTSDDITAPPVLQVTYTSGEYDGDAFLAELDTAGKGDDGNKFVFNGSNWAFNMKTKGLASGNYTITVVSGAAAEYVIDPTCNVGLTVQ